MAARTTRKVNRPKQPRQSSRAASSSEAMKSRTKTLSEYQAEAGKVVLIHGETGSGKTALAILEAPRPTMVLDCDTGLDSVDGAKNSDQVILWGSEDDNLELTWEDLDEFRNHIVAGDWDYKTIVVDNITAGQKPVIVACIAESIERLDEDKRKLRDPEIVSQQDWGKIYRRYDKWIRDIKRAGKMRGAHVIFTAGTREWMDDNAGYTKLMPNLEGAERNQIATHMDAVGWLESDEDGRRLHLAPSGAFVTKIRLPVASHGKVPDTIEDPDFNSMIRAVTGIEERSAKAAKGKTKKKRPTRRPK